jgi:hypothetical protein
MIGVGVVSLMFLSVGSEPVRGGAMAEDRLFETAKPQLAWQGDDATDTESTTRVKAVNRQRQACSLPFGSIRRLCHVGSKRG